MAGPFTALILSFDGFASKDSSAATAYMAWRESIVENAPRLGMNIDTLSDAVESRHPLDADTLRLLADSAAQASAHVPRSSDGSVKTLGEQCHIGRTERDSLSIGGYGFLAGPPVPDAIFAASGLFRRAVIPIRAMRCETINHGGTRMAVYGQRQPMLTIFSTPIQSYSAVAYGQSSREKDAHFNDQTVLASERRLKSTYFNWEDLATHIAHREQLVR